MRNDLKNSSNSQRVFLEGLLPEPFLGKGVYCQLWGIMARD